MARKWIGPKCDYTIDPDNRVHTDGKIANRITGTYIGALLGVSPYNSPFMASTRLMGVWGEDISDNPSVRVGHYLEERIIDYQASKHPDLGRFYKAEDIFEKREGNHEDWVSDFEDDVFAGHVDGIITRDGVDYILEVKTANGNGSAKEWAERVPAHYLWQVYLYNHFITKQDKAYFLLGVVDNQTYDNPNSWVPNANNCFMFEVEIDQKYVAEKIEEVRRKYLDTIRKGQSYDYDPENDGDREVLTYLKDMMATKDNLENLINEYTLLHNTNKSVTDSIKDSVQKEKELNERIKTVMGKLNVSEAYGVTVTDSERESFDFMAARADNFDFTKYHKKTTVKTLKLKKQK